MAKKQSIMDKVEPAGQFIKVRRDETSVEEVTAGGILVPQKAQQIPMEAVVLAVNDGVDYEGKAYNPLGLNKGDIVIINTFSGTDYVKLDEKVTFIRPREVVGVIRK